MVSGAATPINAIARILIILITDCDISNPLGIESEL
jgi:hypothetical protein